MRTSRQREAVLRVIRKTVCHPTAEWVYGEVKREIPGISLGTVYRNLRLLTESGDLSSFEGAGGVSRYDACTSSHYHFRCEQCGALIDVEEPVDQELDRRVAVRTGLEVRCHVLEFRGRCRACQCADEVPEMQGGANMRVQSEEVHTDGSTQRG